jgi:hypothetical protein
MERRASAPGHVKLNRGSMERQSLQKPLRSGDHGDLLYDEKRLPKCVTSL